MSAIDSNGEIGIEHNDDDDDKQPKEQQQQQEKTKDKKKKKKTTLFDYTEEELLHEGVLTHYEILNLDPLTCPSQDQVKKAYRKASLKYHPDKTGRDENDYVFLAVKMAHDTLMDHNKRQAYDSTIMPFDEAIPSSRNVLLQDTSLLYQDDDFYDTFGPVFQRNLRFDAKLRPDAVAKNKKSLSSSSSSNGKNHNNNTIKKGHQAPTLGDADTPIEQVHSFYDYWIHFDSWRDFSAQAAEELEVENHLENAESRYEKRFYQKEIDKRAKQLKTKENGRIQLLVERAMDADPRLRQHRLETIQAKERLIQQRQEAAERVQQAKKDEVMAQELAAIELAKIKALEKEQRDVEKKLLRKARQHLRRITSSAYTNLSQALSSPTSCAADGNDDAATLVWPDAYDMGVDVDLICAYLELEQLRDLTKEFEAITHHHQHNQNDHDSAVKSQTRALTMIQQRAIQERTLSATAAANNNNGRLKTASSTVSDDDDDDNNDNNNNNDSSRTNSNNNNNNNIEPWTKEELSTLAKGVKKYPPGGSSRWDQITLYMSNICKKKCPRTKEECIAKYNEVARNNNNNSNASTTTAATAESKTKNGSNSSRPTIAKEATALNGNKASSSSTTPNVAAATGATPATTTTTSTTSTTNNDYWTPEQDEQLQSALSKFPVSMDKNERWTAIAAAVSDKTKKQCVQRFKVIREALQKKK